MGLAAQAQSHVQQAPVAAAGAPAPLPLSSPTSSDAAGGGGVRLPAGLLSGTSPGAGAGAGAGDPAGQGHGHGQGQMLLESLRAGSPAPTPPLRKTALALWDRVVELCEAKRYLEAYKQVIAEPEESCLLRLMQHTGPIVEHLDAESNSRLIRRLIHILSSPSKDPAARSIDHIFGWIRQALKVGIHFTASQVEDLASALQRVASPQCSLPATSRTEAGQLLLLVVTLRR